ncbi:MAG: biopolymer transporter ExbD, partial [Planctomycetota bacterium]
MPLRTSREEMPTLNLAPMIDVVFLLLIFFLVGTKFSELERKIRLQLPEVSRNAALDVAGGRHTIDVYRDGSLRLDGHQIALEELEDTLRHEGNLASVMIRADRAGAFQHVAAAMSVCKAAGVRQLGVSVQEAPTNP